MLYAGFVAAEEEIRSSPASRVPLLSPPEVVESSADA